ncbi:MULTISPECIES: hypothetical protein [unclassified Streptosporangium]|uniref:hypothetical protein n=1 Tax=unclassified Streptosporangium TaxID=2632669 RepID=UPI002E2A0E8A|nr:MULTISPECIES: hypothetical protein [unclassified Streptosporangium]
MSVAETRSRFTEVLEVLNDAAARGRITRVTNRGRKIAAVASMHVAGHKTNTDR